MSVWQISPNQRAVMKANRRLWFSSEMGNFYADEMFVKSAWRQIWSQWSITGFEETILFILLMIKRNER